ncbi:alpha/beta hydrolase [Streptomyces sp. UNOC14_S4]|uniref:alpha/beta hydrolase n=1 Tax=Streptomyces sp. UNOC14_S4 TaxID=2872340 RepID=UPI001E54455C|nr:alpha/beta hydrolase [Streptomyces sp. UNOC14_S4]MCC3771522.1 alpha/beta hydrolase [Streptomyces sp. UNOC14_S4]
MTSVRRTPRPPRLPRAAKVSAPLAAAVLLAPGITGCSDSGQAAGERDLTSYYEQHITWKPCARETDRAVREETEKADARAECGRLTVPYSYADPGKGELRLALMRYRTKDQEHRAGSLVLNFGGPGESGLRELKEYGPDGFSKAGTRYDLVSFDPRGVGASSPVLCGGGPAAYERPTSPDLPGAAGMADFLEAQEKALQRCKRTAGRIIPYVGTVNAARDLDVLRAALGEKKLDYLGFSYGTKLGAVYAHHFPKNVGRMVMDGVDEPAPNLKDTTLAQTAAYQRALRHAVELCTSRGDEDCMLGSDTDKAMANVARAFNRLDDAPLDWPGGRKVDREAAIEETMGLLRSRESLPETPNLLAAIIYHVRPGEAAELGRAAADRATGRREDSGHDGVEEGMTAINCADTTDRYTVEQVVSAYHEFVRASPVFGPFMAAGMAACTGWPQPGDAASHDVRADGAPKILMHTTEYDPATPVQWLRRMAAAVGPAVTMTDTGGGHSVYGTQDAGCVNERIDAFLLDGTLPPDRSTCT